jgi:hypothetical protein
MWKLSNSEPRMDIGDTWIVVPKYFGTEISVKIEHVYC